MNATSLEIIIPSWNGKALLEKNLPAVCAALDQVDASTKSITVVDDGSTDGTAVYLKSHYPEISCLQTIRNSGFQQAINLGVRHSHADIILLLNNDVEPAADSFQHLFKHFKSNSKLFGVSGRIYSSDKSKFLYGNRSASFKWGHFQLKEKDEYDSSQSLFVCGGAGAFRRTLFLELGCFDLLFSPFYYEEQDISYRALKRGLEICYEPDSIMYHEVQASISKRLKQWQISLISARNNYLFVLKNITDLRWTLSFLLLTPIFALLPILKGNFRFLIAFFLAIPRLPKALLGRFKEQSLSIKKDREILEVV